MKNFCKYCGSKLDETGICGQCALTIKNSPDRQKFSEENGTVVKDAAVNEGKNVLRVIITCIALAFLLIVTSIIAVISNNEYKKPIQNLCKAYNSDNPAYLIAASPYGTLRNAAIDTLDIDELSNSRFNDSMDALQEKFGTKFKIIYKILSKEKLPESDLKKLNDLPNLENAKVSAGYRLRVEFTIKGEETSRTRTAVCNIVKCNGQWVSLDIIPADFKSLFT